MTMVSGTGLSGEDPFAGVGLCGGVRVVCIQYIRLMYVQVTFLFLVNQTINIKVKVANYLRVANSGTILLTSSRLINTTRTVCGMLGKVVNSY